ncbi:MAG: hypoxanthine phosphoribosyltransferase [Bacteroidales bacterium]|nr:hypoxanthine phosphoribosyltransferase [Bacteroidales bacterium]
MKNIIKVRDKEFSLFISFEEIDTAITKVANEINNDLKGQTPLFLVILNGAFMFAADLFKKIDLDCEISFVKLASYTGTQTSSIVKELLGLSEDIKGRTIIIVEDIVDTGITMESMIKQLKEKEVKEIRIATLLFKPDAFIKKYNIDYVGMKIPNDFIVGYGLDYNGHGRNLKDIYKIIE